MPAETETSEDVVWLANCACGQRWDFTDQALRETYPDLNTEFDEGLFTTNCPVCDQDVVVSRLTVKPIPFEHWLVLPPDSGCVACGRDHEEWMPHDQPSLVYQYQFRSKNGRWPTWHDAMAHCTPQVRDQWIDALKDHGVDVGDPPEQTS